MAPRKFDRYMVAVEAATHPKFARLTDSERLAHFVGVLAVAARAPVRGCLLVGKLPATPADVARAAGVSEKVARSAMDKLRAVGVIEPDVDRDCERVHDWDDVNPPPKIDSTNAERQRRHRDRNGDRNAPRNTSRNGVTEGARNAPRNAGNADITLPEVEVEVELPPSAKASVGSRRARRAATRQIDQTRIPDEYPPHLLPVLADVLPILRTVWELRGGREPQPRGVALAVMRQPRADHRQIARRLEHWLTAGRGQRASSADIAARYGDWVAGEDARQQAIVVPMRRETASDWLREDFVDGEPITDATVVDEEAS